MICQVQEFSLWNKHFEVQAIYINLTNISLVSLTWFKHIQQMHAYMPRKIFHFLAYRKTTAQDDQASRLQNFFMLNSTKHDIYNIYEFKSE